MSGFYSDNEILIFIDNLKLLRIVNGITQSDLSKSLGYSEKIIARIESNSYNLSPFLVKEISGYFGVSEKDLFKEGFEKSYLTIEKKNKMDKSALLDLEFYLLMKKTLNSAIIKTFYPIKRDFKNIRSESNEIKILSIFDLIIYIPLPHTAKTEQSLIRIRVRTFWFLRNTQAKYRLKSYLSILTYTLLCFLLVMLTKPLVTQK